MKSSNFWMIAAVLGLAGFYLVAPEVAFANFGGFESRVNGLTKSIVTIVLPALSILGLLYASMLAVTGDGAAKGKIVTVVVCSIIGFLAPVIIRWLQSAAGY